MHIWCVLQVEKSSLTDRTFVRILYLEYAFCYKSKEAGMATANTSEGRRARNAQRLRRLLHSVCDLLAVISLSLVFGGALGLLFLITGQK